MRRYFNSNPVGCSLALIFIFLILLFNFQSAFAQAPEVPPEETTLGVCITGTNNQGTMLFASCDSLIRSGTTWFNPPTSASWMVILPTMYGGAGGTYGQMALKSAAGASLGRWTRSGACPSGTTYNTSTGFCTGEELQCDIDEALSFYMDDVFTETLLRPATVENGTASENFCSSNCEVQHTTTITTVQPENSNNLFVTQSDTYDVVELTCDNIDPDSVNFTASDYPEYTDEPVDVPDDVDDPDGPDDQDDPDAPPSDDPPTPPPPGDFCTYYPSHSLCTDPGGGGGGSGAVCGGPGLPPCNVKLFNNSGASSAFCTTMPTGTGDRLMLAMLIQQWRTMCATEKAGREIEQEIKQGFDCRNATDGSLCQRISALGEGLEGEDPGATTFDNSGIGEIPDYETLLQDANDQRVADIGATGTGEFEFTANFNPLTTLMMSVIPQPAACSAITATYGVEMQIDTCLLGQYRQAMGWGFYVLTMWGIFLIAARKREV